MPPSVRDWVPEGHLVWTVLDAVAELDLSGFYAVYRVDGHGRPAYEPSMMVALLLYAYARGNRSSRGIERACIAIAAARWTVARALFVVSRGALSGWIGPALSRAASCGRRPESHSVAGVRMRRCVRAGAPLGFLRLRFGGGGPGSRWVSLALPGASGPPPAATLTRQCTRWLGA
jgi:Transposase domain (DUF772)